MKDKLIKNYKLILGMILGVIISASSVFATSVLTSDKVSYDNTNSKLSSTNIKDAIDEINTKANETYNRNIVGSYTYNASTCLTYNSSCSKNTCYKSKTAGSCKAGTIIKYKVNDSTTREFYVLHDDGNTITLLDSANILSGIPWETTNNNALGPTNALSKLNSAVSEWSNVNEQVYASGYTNFKTNPYNACKTYNSCTSNKYDLGSITSKARMITVQEAVALGCTETSGSCPKWMVVNTPKSVGNEGYWTMNAYTEYGDRAWNIYYSAGVFSNNGITRENYNGMRAVIVISK